jgi:hypothetical protein
MPRRYPIVDFASPNNALEIQYALHPQHTVLRTGCQNHDIMAVVAGVGVARDEAGEAGIAQLYPQLPSSTQMTTITIYHLDTCIT